MTSLLVICCFPTQLHETWWRHQMEIFSAVLALCAGNSSVTGEFPSQRPVTRIFYVFFDLRMHKRLSKQLWSWWSETPMRSFVWRRTDDKPLSGPIIPCLLMYMRRSEFRQEDFWQFFSSRIECRPVPSWNMTRSTLKRGSKSWVWVNDVKNKMLYDVYLDSKAKLWIPWTI